MRNYKSIWPCPVYVARFAGGETVRMSFHSRAGKPLDFGRGRRIACAVIGNERGREAGRADVLAKLEAAGKPYEPGKTIIDWFRIYGRDFAPAADIEAGHVEWDGVTYPDPHFAPAAAEPATKPKADPVARVLAAIGKLSADQREAVLAALVPIAGFDDAAADLPLAA